VLGVAAVAAYYLLPWNSTGQLALYDGIGFSSAAAIAFGALLNRPASRLPWLLFATGQAAFAVGDVIFNFSGAVTPSIADVFYLGGYPLIAVGLGLLIVRLREEQRRAGLLEAAIFSVGFTLVQWVFVMAGIVDARGSTAGKSVALAYPVMDILLLAALAVFFLTPARRTVAYRYLAASVVLLLVADEIYGMSPGTYASTTPLDAAWLLSYVLWGAAALHPTMRALSESRRAMRTQLGGARITFLAAGLLTAPVVLVIESATSARVEPVPVAIAAAALSLLVLARFAGMVRVLDRTRSEERAARAEAEAARALLQEQNERLREADRLKDEFVALISHDLRTPLTSIMGYVELVLDESLPEDVRRHLEVVDRNSERLLRLVNDLLFVARLEAGELDLQPVELDLAHVARQAVVEAGPRAEAKAIDLRCAAVDVPTIAADRGRMFQLLDNLISNAIKFTPAGGRVDVSVERVADAVRLEVADTGIGIPADDQRRLFDRFFRARAARDRQIPGSGLGLYISRAIVVAHGGRIDAESTTGIGTRFSIELPLETRLVPRERELVA
jgi:signal transduction histidine kinase